MDTRRSSADEAAKPEAATRILIADDEPVILRVMAHWLEAEGYACTCAHDGLEAWEQLRENDYALLISDINMPGLTGMELLARVKETYADLAVIMVTAVDDRALAIDALRHGAYGYIIKPFNQNELLISVANALERRRLLRVSLAYEHDLEAKVRERTADIREREEEITLRLVSASEYRDDETGAHIRRMALYAVIIARALGWSEEEIEHLRLAAPMHDIGKIGIPDNVLQKPGTLTPEEFAVMQRHTEIGAAIIGDSRIEVLDMARHITLCHHERWDGTGYPQHLTGNAIPPSARVVAIADVYDALLSDRVYRPAYSEEDALRIMAENRGTHFDPVCFDAFLHTLPLLREVRHDTPPHG